MHADKSVVSICKHTNESGGVREWDIRVKGRAHEESDVIRPWECVQSGGQNNKIFLHENRPQFPEEKTYFVLSSILPASS